jgi:hypothetical protein
MVVSTTTPLPVVVVRTAFGPSAYHTIQPSFKSGEERGLQEFGISEEVIREDGWYWLAAGPRTATSGERSIWALFYVCPSRFLDVDGTRALTCFQRSKMGSVKSPWLRCRPHSIFLSNLVLDPAIYHHDSRPSAGLSKIGPFRTYGTGQWAEAL